MARKKAEPKPKATDRKAKFEGYVNVYLTKEEKKLIRGFDHSEEFYFQFIQDLVHAGYKFSLSYSEKGKFYSATVYGQYADRPNAGMAMSLKHAEPDVALSALYFCLEEAGLQEDWSHRYTTGGSNDW